MSSGKPRPKIKRRPRPTAQTKRRVLSQQEMLKKLQDDDLPKAIRRALKTRFKKEQKALSRLEQQFLRHMEAHPTNLTPEARARARKILDKGYKVALKYNSTSFWKKLYKDKKVKKLLEKGAASGHIKFGKKNDLDWAAKGLAPRFFDSKRRVWFAVELDHLPPRERQPFGAFKAENIFARTKRENLNLSVLSAKSPFPMSDDVIENYVQQNSLSRRQQHERLKEPLSFATPRGTPSSGTSAGNRMTGDSNKGVQSTSPKTSIPRARVVKIGNAGRIPSFRAKSFHIAKFIVTGVRAAARLSVRLYLPLTPVSAVFEIALLFFHAWMQKQKERITREQISTALSSPKFISAYNSAIKQHQIAGTERVLTDWVSGGNGFLYVHPRITLHKDVTTPPREMITMNRFHQPPSSTQWSAELYDVKLSTSRFTKPEMKRESITQGTPSRNVKITRRTSYTSQTAIGAPLISPFDIVATQSEEAFEQLKDFRKSINSKNTGVYVLAPDGSIGIEATDGPGFNLEPYKRAENLTKQLLKTLAIHATIDQELERNNPGNPLNPNHAYHDRRIIAKGAKLQTAEIEKLFGQVFVNTVFIAEIEQNYVNAKRAAHTATQFAIRLAKLVDKRIELFLYTRDDKDPAHIIRTRGK